jgi:purine-binding chemotaxis protein CheW
MSESGAASANGERRWDVLAREAAQRRDFGSEPVELLQLLSFELEGAPYALPVECVREIVRIRPITPVPRVSEDVRGVISLRGEIVQVVDLRRRLGLERVEPNSRSRVIVVHGGDGRVAGLLVDAVTEVLSVADDQLRPASGEAGSVETLCVRDEEFIFLVDLDRVLAVDGE